MKPTWNGGCGIGSGTVKSAMPNFAASIPRVDTFSISTVLHWLSLWNSTEVSTLRRECTTASAMNG